MSSRYVCIKATVCLFGQVTVHLTVIEPSSFGESGKGAKGHLTVFARTRADSVLCLLRCAQLQCTVCIRSDMTVVKLECSGADGDGRLSVVVWLDQQSPFDRTYPEAYSLDYRLPYSTASRAFFFFSSAFVLRTVRPPCTRGVKKQS